MFPFGRFLRPRPPNREGEILQLRQQCQNLRQQTIIMNGVINDFTEKEIWLQQELERIQRKIGFDLRQGADSENASSNLQSERPRQVYRDVISYVENLVNQNISLYKKSRNQERQLGQLEKEAHNASMRHQKATSELLSKIHSLQPDRQTLCDDQCLSESRRLQQSLNQWIRYVFKDRAVMNGMTSTSLQRSLSSLKVPEDMMKALHGKIAYIQSSIAGFIFEIIFGFAFALSKYVQNNGLLFDIATNLRTSVDSSTWVTWRSATSKGLTDKKNPLDTHARDLTMELAKQVKTLFGSYFSSDINTNRAEEKLLDIIRECLIFKVKLEQQEFDYYWWRSSEGTDFSSNDMESCNFIDEMGSTVQKSIWPSLYKVSFDHERLLIAPEIVWTKGPVVIDDPSKTDQADDEPEKSGQLEVDHKDESVILIERDRQE